MFLKKIIVSFSHVKVNGIKPQSKLWTQNTDSSLQQAVGYYDKINPSHKI